MNYICMSHEEHTIPKISMVVMVHNWDHPGQWDTFQRINIRTHTCMSDLGHILTDSGLHDVLVIVYASKLSFVSSAAKTLLPELFKDISRFFEDFCDEKRKYRITQLPFKENINEQLSIPDSTATDDIVYIFPENKRGNVAIHLTVWLIPKHKRLQQWNTYK